MTEIGKQVPLADALALAERYRAWERWGPDDEAGALNHVTPDRVRAAAGLVRQGKVFSLALPLDDQGPMNGTIGRINPAHHMLRDGGDVAQARAAGYRGFDYTDDAMYIVLQCATQWDAFAHVFYDGQMYNGLGPEHVTSKGAARNSIMTARDRMVGRGVLLDVPALTGRRWLEPGESIEREDLEACCERQGVEVGEGDFVLVRTGRLAAIRERGAWGDEYAGGSAPGLGVSAADFLCPRNVAAVAADTMSTEVVPFQTEPEMAAPPLHVILMLSAGIHLGEMFDLEELAADCAADGVYEFLLSAPPLTITGAVGSPINPQAIK